MVTNSRIVKSIFYGNYFYGLCAIALAVEAALQQNVPLNSFLFYLVLFAATVFYYTIPYHGEKTGEVVNPRSRWYKSNHKLVQLTQALMLLTVATAGGYYMYLHFDAIIKLSAFHWLIICVFPLAGLMYYGIDNNANLRRLGLLKPFIIGFIWAGLVTVYPLFASIIENNLHYTYNLQNLWLFIKNLMYVGVLCIMFDIKDYATDYREKLHTIIVKSGLRKTIFYILIPLIILGFGTFFYYALSNSFPLGKIILNTIPFVLLYAVAYSLYRRRSLLYYLVVVDGLMLIKGICGSLAMLYF